MTIGMIAEQFSFKAYMKSHLGEYKLKRLLNLSTMTPRGAIIELGIFNGGTLYELARKYRDRPCYGFDTFEGMPSEFYNETEGHKPGEFKSNFDEVHNYLKVFKHVTLIKGVFPESYKEFGEINNVSFIHMDMDHGEPTKLALEIFWDKMVPKGIILFDDYDWQHCLNIKPVVDDFASKHGLTVHKLTEHQAYIVKG